MSGVLTQRRRAVITGTAAGAMVVLAVLDVLFPGVGFVVLLVLPLAVAAVTVGPRGTAVLGFLACALALVAGWLDGDLAELDAWLNVGTLAVAAVLATWFSSWLTRYQDQARRRDARFQLLAQSATDMVAWLTPSGSIDWVSPSSTSLLGLQPYELRGCFVGQIVDPGDRGTIAAAITRASAGSAPTTERIRLVRSTGERLWVETSVRLLAPEDPAMGVGVGIRDVDAEVRANAQLAHEVDFDGLTGLAKRGLALSRIQDVLDRRRTDGWALLCVGVDGMRAINLGHSFRAGDVVLSTVAERLVADTGAADRVARIGGDEFVAILTDIVSPTDAADAAERLLTAVRGPVQVDGMDIDVTACVGVAKADGHNAEELVRDATAAMRQASAQGHDRWEFFDVEQGQASRQGLIVQASLREALQARQVVPWFMPITRLNDASIVGWEALARWILADGTIIEPDSFIPIAERSGLILQLDEAILTASVLALRELPDDQHIAVNISALTLANGSLVALVEGATSNANVEPSRLHFEVTETALLRVTDLIRQEMDDLAERGIKWWVDDFGTGFSSIAHLRDLPITGLKLDRSFTSEISSTPTHATRLAQGLVGLANGLDLRTIAEGIDSQTQATILGEQGWQMGQGWLFGDAQPLSRTMT